MTRGTIWVEDGMVVRNIRKLKQVFLKEKFKQDFPLPVPPCDGDTIFTPTHVFFHQAFVLRCGLTKSVRSLRSGIST